MDNSKAKLVEAVVRTFSDAGSIPAASTIRLAPQALAHGWPQRRESSALSECSEPKGALFEVLVLPPSGIMFHVYILLCSDCSYYVGHTRDLLKRLDAHNRGVGSSHTAKRRPVRLVYQESQATRAAAARRERQLKGWSRKKKDALIRGDISLLRKLSRRRRKLPR